MATLIPNFTTAQIAALTTANIAAMGTDQISKGLTTDQITALRTDQIAALIERGPGELLHHYMESGMLLGIKARVEASGPITQVSAAAAP